MVRMKDSGLWIEIFILLMMRIEAIGVRIIDECEWIEWSDPPERAKTQMPYYSLQVCPGTRLLIPAKPPVTAFLAPSAPCDMFEPRALAPFAPASSNVPPSPYDPFSSLPFLSARLIPSFEINWPAGFNKPLSPSWFPTRLFASSWNWSTWSIPVTLVLERESI